MSLKSSPIIALLMLLALASPISEGYESGKMSSGSSGCGCHYPSGGATVTISGHPSQYTAGQTYSLTISVTGGISGNGGGFSLDVDKGTLSAGISISVNVNQAQNSATHQITGNNQRSWTVDWTAPSTGSGTVTFDVAGLISNSNGGNSGDTWGTASYQISEAITSTNDPPTVSGTQLSPDPAYTTDILTLSYTYADQDGDSESGTMIRWYSDGGLVSSRNDQMTIPSSMTQKNQVWNATITPSDGEDYGNPVNTGTIMISNSAPYVQSASISPSNATEGDDLTISWTDGDADADSLTVSGIEWYVDGTKVSAFDDDTTIPSVAIRDGDIWAAKVRVTDGEVDSEWFMTPNLTIGSDNHPPQLLSLSLGGPYTTVDDLVATAQGNDPDGDSVTYEWAWSGTSFTTHTLPADQTSKGQTWTVSCRVTDGSLYSEWSSTSVTIQNSPPVLLSVEIDQETIYFEDEATYSFVANDPDNDELIANEQWILDEATGNLELQLSVTDNSFSTSNTLNDTVSIINSPPVAVYDGQTVQDALSNLTPIVNSSDANGDTVSLTWAWHRNGFLTSNSGASISSEFLSPGDIWTALIIPNDGSDDGQQLSIDFTISNTPPSAVINSPDVMWIGASALLSAEDSSDQDGVIVRAVWYKDGVIVNQGMTYTLNPIVDGEEIEVKVFDDMGDYSSASLSIVGATPPEAQDIDVAAKDGEVSISWKGNAESWEISSSIEGIIGITSDNSFTHKPLITGAQEYTINPVIGGQTISGGTVSSSVDISDGHIETNSGPSEIAGLIFGIIMILVGCAGVAYSFIPWRD